eukprot:58984_1
MSAEHRLNKIVNHLHGPKMSRSGVSVQDTATRSMDEIESKLQELVGSDLGASSWIKLTQKDLDTFSNLTVDHNFIHKKDAAKKGSPFGDPIAHGLLTLSMTTQCVYQINSKYTEELSLNQLKAPVNYGYDKVRFIGPVLVDNEIRARFKLKSVSKTKKRNAIKYIFEMMVETKNKNTGKITDVLFAEWCGMNIYNV